MALISLLLTAIGACQNTPVVAQIAPGQKITMKASFATSDTYSYPDPTFGNTSINSWSASCGEISSDHGLITYTADVDSPADTDGLVYLTYQFNDALGQVKSYTFVLLVDDTISLGPTSVLEVDNNPTPLQVTADEEDPVATSLVAVAQDTDVDVAAVVGLHIGSVSNRISSVDALSDKYLSTQNCYVYNAKPKPLKPHNPQRPPDSIPNSSWVWDPVAGKFVQVSGPPQEGTQWPIDSDKKKAPGSKKGRSGTLGSVTISVDANGNLVISGFTLGGGVKKETVQNADYEVRIITRVWYTDNWVYMNGKWVLVSVVKHVQTGEYLAIYTADGVFFTQVVWDPNSVDDVTIRSL